MAAFAYGANWAGIVFTLDHAETQQVTHAGEDVAQALAAIAGPLDPPFDLALGVVAAYIFVNAAIITAVDQGNGVYLTLPWVAIWFGQWWLVIPTPVQKLTGAITVRRPNGNLFTPNQDWTHEAYFGTRGTFFADVTGMVRRTPLWLTTTRSPCGARMAPSFCPTRTGRMALTTAVYSPSSLM